MLSRAAEMGFLTPTNEKVSAIGARSARIGWRRRQRRQEAQFWSKQQNWLNVPRHYLNRITPSR